MKLRLDSIVIQQGKLKLHIVLLFFNMFAVSDAV